MLPGGMTRSRALWLTVTHIPAALIPFWLRSSSWLPMPTRWGVRRWEFVPEWLNKWLIPSVAGLIVSVIGWLLGYRDRDLLMIIAITVIGTLLMPVVWPKLV